jgi:PAS domain S-box-containing protein
MQVTRDITAQKRAETELRRSEALKTFILESAPDAILLIDLEGKIREWNPAAQKIFGYAREQALGQSPVSLIAPVRQRKLYRDGLTYYLMTGAASLMEQPVELKLRRADGSEFDAEMSVSRNYGEWPSRYTAIVRDITGRKKAEAALRESEERYRMLIEDVKDYAIYMLDPEGLVTTWNTGAERIKGYTAAEVLGQPFSIFFTYEDIVRGLPGQLLQAAERDGQSVHNGLRVRKDGSRFWTQDIITALRDAEGKLRGFSKVAHDVTRQKELDEKILQLNEELERRVAERTAQLEVTNQELEAFSYSISHDLRAPLLRISGFADILRSEAAANLDEKHLKYLQTIVAGAQQMSQLIDALLDFSRTGRTEMREATVNLAALVEDAQHELRRDIEGRDIVWRIGELPGTRGDPVMLRQVIINLLSNALKYTRPRRRAVIEIGSQTEAGETVYFIRDNGVGFDMNYVGKLFGVFQRLHSARDFEGTGIGLANVRLILRRHGGRVWAESRLDKGATFYFTIPNSTEGVSP